MGYLPSSYTIFMWLYTFCQAHKQFQDLTNNSLMIFIFKTNIRNLEDFKLHTQDWNGIQKSFPSPAMEIYHFIL